MLFDLQGRRKTAIKVIYLGLAVLMAGGLVLFGVGSNVSGGLADYFTGGGNTVDTEEFEKRVTAAETTVEKSPKNAKAHEDLIRARFQLAGAGDNYNSETFTFSKQGEAVLTELGKDWKTYVKVKQEPNPQIALLAVQAFVNLQDAEGAANAQRVVAASREEASDYLALFQYALAAGDERTANLSAKKAVRLADVDDRKQIKNQIRDLRKTYKKAQKEGISKQVQEQINQQLNQGGGLNGLGAPQQ